LIPFLLAEAEKFGEVSLLRVYGKWHLSSKIVYNSSGVCYKLF
jgi:hypothetical protein